MEVTHLNKKSKGKSVQEFLGIKTFTKYGLSARGYELIFFQKVCKGNTILFIYDKMSVFGIKKGFGIVFADKKDCEIRRRED